MLNRNRMAAVLLGLAVLLVTACANSILFVGNSFTFGGGSPPVQEFQPETVTDLNREGVGGVPALFKALHPRGGPYLRRQPRNGFGDEPGFLQTPTTRRRRLLQAHGDDVVVQGFSTLDADAPGDPGKIIDYSARLAQLFHAANPQGDVRLVATWPRADQTYLESGHWFGKPIETMALDVRAAYDQAAAHSSNIRAVIPVGQAWNRAIADGIAVRNPYQGVGAGQINLWSPDGYHATVYGYYLAALVIYGSVTGRDPRSLGREERAAARLGIAPATAFTLQRIAFETLASERKP